MSSEEQLKKQLDEWIEVKTIEKVNKLIKKHHLINCPLHAPLYETCKTDKLADEADEKYDLLRGN